MLIVSVVPTALRVVVSHRWKRRAVTGRSS